MHQRFFGFISVTNLIVLLMCVAPAHAEDYMIDADHAGVNFKISHLGLSWIHGRFNEYAGHFSIEPDAGKCTFSMTIRADSIDTANPKRDGHLRSPDFFNTKQFPAITFKSTSVKEIKDGYQVTGDFTLHGVTKSITFAAMGGRKAEFPKGVQRTGFSTELTIKRSEFGIEKFADAVGDNVYLMISFEGKKK